MVLNKEKIKDIFKKFEAVFWVFIIGSVFGFLIEMIYASILTKTFVIRRGLIYGPFIQVYGMGAVLYYLLIKKVDKPWQAFLGGMLMGGILEYLCSFYQEILFGTISWDYTNLPLNINGRINILHCTYWGIIAILFLKVIYPQLIKMKKWLYTKWGTIVTILIAVFITYDITISCMAAGRQMARHRNIEPKNKIEEYLDVKYTDEVLDKVYNNKKEL